jgi:hypothetical protein
MINKPYLFIILGLTVIISNVLGLVASILVYFYKPTLFEENLWGSIIVVCFLYNFFAIIISRKYWLHAPGEQQIKFAPIKGMAIIYLLYSFLGFLSVQALLQWPIIGIGGFNLIFIFGIGFGFSILLFPINRVPKKIYSWLLKRRVFGRRVLRAIL